MKTLIIAISCFFSASVFSQNITNTLGTGGLFKVKDATSDYLTVSQLTGQVTIYKPLRLSDSYQGVIFIGPTRFLHKTGPYNTFLGSESGNFTMTGWGNTGLGPNTLFSNTTGGGNTAIGDQSLYSNTTGYSNTVVGSFSMSSNTDGARNTALGVQSLNENTSGDSNTAVGYESMYSNLTGFNNTTLGNGSLRSNTIGYYNTAVGLGSLSLSTTGNYNTCLGSRSLLSSTGDFNTGLGYSTASTTTTGNNVTCIGYNADASSGTVSNQITLGNSSVTSLRCNVQTITSLSDARDKMNIKDLSLGLDFLMKVKPRLFNWDKREWYENNTSDGSKMTETPTAGFIAQELDEIQTTENAEWLNLVLKDNPEKFEATYGNLLPVMVKAIQELKVENEKLKVENIELKNDDKATKKRLLKLEQTQNKLVNE